MKKLIQAFATLWIASLITGTTVMAQETNPYDLFNTPKENHQPQLPPEAPTQNSFGGMKKLPLMNDCGPIDTIMKKIRAFGEVQMTISDSVIQIPGKVAPQANVIKGSSSLYVNPTTGSYSIIFYLPDELANSGYGVEACITSAGMNFQPGLQGTEI